MLYLLSTGDLIGRGRAFEVVGGRDVDGGRERGPGRNFRFEHPNSQVGSSAARREGLEGSVEDGARQCQVD